MNKKELKKWAKKEAKKLVNDSLNLMKRKSEACDLINAISVNIYSCRDMYEIEKSLKALELASSLINQLCKSSTDYIVKMPHDDEITI